MVKYSFWNQDFPVRNINFDVLASHGINEFWETIGTFNGGSTLQYWYNPSDYPDAIKRAHNAGILFYAVMENIWQYQNPIDLDNATLVTAIKNAVLGSINKYGFDGWVDVMEAWTSNRLVEGFNWYYRDILVPAVHGLGRKFVVTNQCWNADTLSLWIADTGADYNNPMVYGWPPYNVPANWIQQCMSISKSPVNIGIMLKPEPTTQADPSRVQETLSGYVDPYKNNSKYAGINIWGINGNTNTAYMTPQDWTVWDTWLSGQPQPEPVDCNTATDCQNKYGSAGAGKHWECKSNVCVKVADPTPTPSPSIAARTVGPFGVPSALLRQMWRAREKLIRKEVHRKLHPLV